MIDTYHTAKKPLFVNFLFNPTVYDVKSSRRFQGT